MSKKHFVAIANTLRASKPGTDLDPLVQQIRTMQWRQDVDRIADVCADANPNFNRARFFDACGVEG